MSTDGLLSVTNWVYLLSLFIAAVASVGLWRLSIASGEEKDRQLETYKTEAAERIATANSTAEHAKAEAARANERAAALEKEAADARVEQERIRAANLQLEQTVTAERAARIKIEQAVSQRQLTPEQQTTIIDYLRKHPARVPVMTRWYNDAESVSYAWIVNSVLQRAPVAQIESEILTAPGADGQYGLYVSRGAGDPIIEAFARAGVDVHSWDNSSQADRVDILIGIRPPLR